MFWRSVRSRPIRLFLIDHTYNTSVTAVTTAVEPLTFELPAEREASYLWLISGRGSADGSLLATRRLVDRAIPAVRSALQTSSLFANSRPAINELFAQLAQLSTIRAAIDSGTMSPAAAFQAYSGIVDAEFRFFQAAIQYRDSSLAVVSIGTVDGAYAYEMASREATLVAGALANNGQMSPSARQLFASSAASRSLLMNDALVFLTPNLRAGYASIVNSPEYRQYQAMEDQISASLGTRRDRRQSSQLPGRLCAGIRPPGRAEHSAELAVPDRNPRPLAASMERLRRRRADRAGRGDDRPQRGRVRHRLQRPGPPGTGLRPRPGNRRHQVVVRTGAAQQLLSQS